MRGAARTLALPHAVVARDEAGLKYLQVTMVEPGRWVLDVMLSNGRRGTLDLRDGMELSARTVAEGLFPDLAREWPEVGGAALRAARFAVLAFGERADLAGSGIRAGDPGPRARAAWAAVLLQGVLPPGRTAYGAPLRHALAWHYAGGGKTP